MARAKALTLGDKFAITDLVGRYCWALDIGDPDALAECFHKDAIVIEEVFEDADRWVGHEGIRAMSRHYGGAPGFPGRQHHVSNIQIEGRGDRAKVHAFVFVTECRGEPPYVIRFSGYYEDELRKRRGQWRFQQRIIRLWDGPVLARFPGHDGSRVPRRRPAELTVRR